MSPAFHFLFPPFRLDALNEQLWHGAEEISVRRKTFAVLRYLVEHPGHLVTKEQFLEAVWRGTYVSESLPTTCIRELRKALGDEAKTPRFIETVHGRGYRFIAAVTTAPHQSLESRAQRLESKNPSAQFSEIQTLNPRRQTLDVPLVGREPELAQLHHWWENALSGERQIVFVTGEPGIGKTALVEAFVASTGSSAKFRVSSSTRRSFRPQSSVLSTQSSNSPTPSTQAEAEAGAYFQQAIDIARKQQAKSPELRAVMSLARLWQQLGKKIEAHEMLAEIYGWFTEGFDTKDLQEAKALLQELA